MVAGAVANSDLVLRRQLQVVIGLAWRCLAFLNFWNASSTAHVNLRARLCSCLYSICVKLVSFCYVLRLSWCFVLRSLFS